MAQLVHTVHNFIAVINNDGQGDAVFLDFAKAIDRVSHRKLSHELKRLQDNDCP